MAISKRMIAAPSDLARRRHENLSDLGLDCRIALVTVTSLATAGIRRPFKVAPQLILCIEFLRTINFPHRRLARTPCSPGIVFKEPNEPETARSKESTEFS